MSKRVLFTGASGFIGSNVLEYMLERTGWQFVVISSWAHKGNPLLIPKDDRVEVVTHDLQAPIPELGEFDYIINLASESHVDRSISDPETFTRNNIDIMLNVLYYARTHNPEKLLHFSTDEVYGANEHDEWDILEPTNPYSGSKAAQESIALGYAATYKLPLIITNSNNVIGKNQNPEKFVPKVANLIRNDKKVQIHTINGVPGRRYWNPVENVADALIFILGQDYKMNGNRIPRYGIGGGEELDNLEMAKLVATMLDRKLDYEIVDARSVRPAYDDFYPENMKSLTVAGWLPPLTLVEGLEWLLM
jgi:dTDP-glucose 4,6-dehydratase